MDQYLSTVIITLITGVFSIITLIIQRNQNKVISKIDEQSTFIDREKALKQKLTKKEKERESVLQQMMILILDTNIHILKNTNIGDGKIPIDDICEMSNKLKDDIKSINEDIEDINNEYALVIDITSELQKEIERHQSQSK